MKVATAKLSKRVPTATVERKARFRAALTVAGMTAGQWALNEDITPTYLSHFLNGRHESIRLGAKIDAFIAKHLKDLKRAG